ncbi:hypothetical protein OAC94_00965 [Gammaproteobacteria bacterium]|nr:hypothetical protein [Gammaproteobacteria bacterium]
MNDEDEWRYDTQKILNIGFTLAIAVLLYQNYQLSDEMDWALDSSDVKKIVENCEPRGEISYSKELEYGEIKC